MNGLNEPPRQAGRWNRAKNLVLLLALAAVGVLFVSGVGIFAYQMLRAG